jgi:hypothetical protein
MNELVFLATLSKNNEKMRQAIAAATEEKTQKSGKKSNPLMAAIGSDPNDPNIGIIKLTDLNTFYTQTGRNFTRTEIRDPKSNELYQSFTMEFGKQLRHPTYFWFGNKVESDMTTLARAVKAAGHEYIQLDIDFNNQDLAIKRARQAYRAAIEAGFPPDKIRLKMNGQAKEAKDIFSPSALATNDKRAEELAQAPKPSFLLNPESTPDKKSIDEVKAAMKELREEAKKTPAVLEVDTSAEEETVVQTSTQSI